MHRDLTHTLKHNIAYLDSATQTHMTPGNYSHFYRWALSDANPMRDMWLQLIGLKQLVKLTAELLHGIVPDGNWDDIVAFSLPMNAYQIFEVVSDNIAIGITHPHSNAKRERLVQFNDAMLLRLRGKPLSLPMDMQSNSRISTFEQSLSPHKHRAVAQAYLKCYPNASLDDLEFTITPTFVANIETAYDLWRKSETLIGGKLVTDGLLARYQAMNDLILSPNMPIEKRITVSADAILVVPTIGYYIAVIAEHIYKLDNTAALLNDAHVLYALQEASVLVRLLNDLGSLVKQSPDEHRQVIDTLPEPPSAYTTFRGYISQQREGAHITRLQKDAIHGEFNLALHGLEEAPPTDETIRTFLDRLAYLGEVYKGSMIRMETHLGHLDKHANSDFIGTLVRRFVYFHQYVYSQSYQAEEGEYAI